MIEVRQKQVQEICIKLQEEQFKTVEDVQEKLKHHLRQSQAQQDKLVCKIDELKSENSKLKEENAGLEGQIKEMVPRNPVQMINQYSLTDEIVLRDISCQTEKITFNGDDPVQLEDAICQVDLREKVDVEGIVAERT